MPYRLSGPEGRRFLRIDYEGEVSAQEILDCFSKAAALAAQSGVYTVLTDCRRMTGGHSGRVLEFVAAELADKPMSAKFKEAVLLPKAEDLAGLAARYEAAALGYGLKVRFFSDEPAALAWLLK